jgi:hypothetical protein
MTCPRPVRHVASVASVSGILPAGNDTCETGLGCRVQRAPQRNHYSVVAKLSLEADGHESETHL